MGGGGTDVPAMHEKERGCIWPSPEGGRRPEGGAGVVEGLREPFTTSSLRLRHSVERAGGVWLDGSTH